MSRKNKDKIKQHRAARRRPKIKDLYSDFVKSAKEALVNSIALESDIKRRIKRFQENIEKEPGKFANYDASKFDTISRTLTEARATAENLARVAARAEDSKTHAEKMDVVIEGFPILTKYSELIHEVMLVASEAEQEYLAGMRGDIEKSNMDAHVDFVKKDETEEKTEELGDTPASTSEE